MGKLKRRFTEIIKVGSGIVASVINCYLDSVPIAFYLNLFILTILLKSKFTRRRSSDTVPSLNFILFRDILFLFLLTKSFYC